jgi:hypothetical protein
MWRRPRRTTRNASAADLAKVRMADITAQSYQIVRQDMIRLSDEDLQNPVALGRRAALAGLSPEASHSRFQHASSNVMGT